MVRAIILLSSLLVAGAADAHVVLTDRRLEKVEWLDKEFDIKTSDMPAANREKALSMGRMIFDAAHSEHDVVLFRFLVDEGDSLIIKEPGAWRLVTINNQTVESIETWVSIDAGREAGRNQYRILGSMVFEPGVYDCLLFFPEGTYTPGVSFVQLKKEVQDATQNPASSSNLRRLWDRTNR